MKQRYPCRTMLGVQPGLDIGFRVFPGLLAGLELRGHPVLAP